jgi:hypothetical protein
LRIKRTRNGVVDWIEGLSPLGFALGFTSDGEKAGRFSPDVCSLVRENYAPHPAAGVLTAEPDEEPAAPEPVRAEPKKPRGQKAAV